MHLLLTAMLCTGCYPIHKLIQPEAKATVVDSHEAPLEGVSVTLISNAYPYGWEKSRDLRPTDARGNITFGERREWRIELLFIHGAEAYFWNWCVEKQGFSTFETEWSGSSQFDADLKVKLESGDSIPCRARR